MMRVSRLPSCLTVGMVCCLGLTALRAEDRTEAAEGIPAKPSFSRDVQPIFARACTSCHGGVKQAGDISFIYADSILPPDGWVVEPGNPEDSILLQRITSSDPDERMPPPDEHPEPLSKHEIEIIRRWIEQGAIWESQWSMAPLVDSQLPPDDDAQKWAKQPLDHRVLLSLKGRGLSPSLEAEPAQWLRRVTFDLTGLPPSLAALDDFREQLNDATTGEAREAVYASVVDRLLESEHYGERWAAMWMDLARYADSKGFEKDPHRDIWPYRNWLIEAFNADMPYDEFSIRQLAGDLLPDASYTDLIATAFHRNTQTNTEGGTDDEEFRMAAVIDRVNTTWTVWQGMTFGCTQCHAHPYEPFENAEYYECLDLFNSSADVDLDSEYPTVPWLEDAAQRDEFQRGYAEFQLAQRRMDELGRKQVAAASWRPLAIIEAGSSSGELAVEGSEVRVAAGTVATGSVYTLTASPSRASGLRFSILPDSENPADWPEQGSVLSQLEVAVVGADGSRQAVELEAVIPDYRAGPYACEEMLNKGAEGFGGYPKLFGPRWVVVTFQEPQDLAEGDLLELKLHQRASVTGGLSNHLRRFQVDVAQTPVWSGDSQSQFIQQRDICLDLEKRLGKFAGAAVPVTRQRDRAARRPTRQFIRGNWLERGELVEPGIPDTFRATAAADLSVTNRLEFAEWLVSDANPLAARVWANRVWAELFGVGIVETQEDFGASGLAPTHPELLEHLAVSMQQTYRWHLKPFLREIVLSATYRQDSRVGKELRARDPVNRLLARGPRTRLTAEMIRDQALAVSGKLEPGIGGASVMPPQPDGVWQQVYSGAQWKTATDADRFRRGLYTYWKRTSPYPGMVAFDAPSRDVCSPRRVSTNTPLQALVTLNSEVYLELAEGLASRVAEQLPSTAQPAEAMAMMFTLVTSREPSSRDIAALAELYTSLGGQAAWQLDVTKPKLDAAADETAAATPKQVPQSTVVKPMQSVALAILNSDWALTK